MPWSAVRSAGLERQPLQSQPGALELRPEQVGLRDLADLVAGTDDLLGLLPERLEPRLELEPPPDQPQFQVCPLHLSQQGEADPLERRLGHGHPRRDGVLPVSTLPWPGERDVQEHLPEAGRLTPIWIPLKPSFWMPRTRVGSASAPAWGTRSRSAETSACARAASGLRASVSETSADSVGSAGSARREGERALVAGRDAGELEQDETEERGHGISAEFEVRGRHGTRSSGAHGQDAGATERATAGLRRAVGGAPSHESSGRFLGGGGGAGACETGSSARASGTATGAATTRAGSDGGRGGGVWRAHGLGDRGLHRGGMHHAALGEGRVQRHVGRRRGAVPAALVERLGPLHHRTGARAPRSPPGRRRRGAARR